MKRRELIRMLKGLGWYFLREGAKHEIWTNGYFQKAIPRHSDIHEALAKNILRTARDYRGKDS